MRNATIGLAIRMAAGVPVALSLVLTTFAAEPATPVPLPVPNYATFVETIDNPYFPLNPGTIYIFDGEQDGENVHNEVEVTRETKTILGVICVVVRDRVTLDGALIEDTLDWYAQDADGNVWYFGEAAKSYEGSATPDTAGSWEAGVDGASAGIAMPANPQVGEPYRQEFYPGEAEDIGQIVRVGVMLTVPAGSYSDVIVTREWSPLEPDVVEEKFYAPGVGQIRAVSIQGENEQLELTQIRTAT